MLVWDNYKTIIHDKWKQRWFDNHPLDIAEYSWNFLFTGGKEIRAKLFCELWNYLSPASEIKAELAFAIECIHVASIILDDTPWMDDAKERRGKPSLHITFSPKKSLLIANDVIVMAVEIWKNNQPTHIPENVWKSLLISKLQKLTMGQWFDLEKKGNLIELASLKTGVLFELVSETVAMCVELDTTFWKIWGNSLGILFQWMDDYLDMEEDKIPNNRNAFNEAYEMTLKNYIYLWQKLEKEIGSQWFDREFGQFMKYYFLNKLEINLDKLEYSSLNNIQIEYPNNLIIPELNSEEEINEEYNYAKHFIFGLNRENIVKRVFKMSENIFSFSATSHNIWNMSEEELEKLI
jgi:geranylgeranyl pyrophosphate synthase